MLTFIQNYALRRKADLQNNVVKQMSHLHCLMCDDRDVYDKVNNFQFCFGYGIYIEVI